MKHLFPAYRPARALLAMLPLIACALPAHADPGDDSEGFHGYFRAGVGATSAKGGRQACFGLGGNTSRYRLGNECDAFGILSYTKEMVKTDDGVSFVGTVGVRSYAPNSDYSTDTVLKTDWRKVYVEAKGLDFLNGGTAWIGKREYRRPDIHMLDLMYTSLTGTGGGVDRMKAGPGKFSYALFKDSDSSVADAGGQVVNSTAALRQNVMYEGIPVNPGGTLDLLTTFISASGEGKHNGWNATLLHNQGGVFGGGNTIGLQYGVGPGASGECCNRLGTSGPTTQGRDVKRLRVFDSLWIQPTNEFSMEFVALLQRDESNAAGKSTWTTLGVRPVYALGKHFKLQGEIGTDRVSFSNGQPTQRLTKFTIAPTITAGKGYWSRPELRLFVTHAIWNDAAKGAVNAANEGGAVFGDRKSGTSYGLQVETWF